MTLLWASPENGFRPYWKMEQLALAVGKWRRNIIAS
jgi:hypothetical protein